MRPRPSNPRGAPRGAGRRLFTVAAVLALAGGLALVGILGRPARGTPTAPGGVAPEPVGPLPAGAAWSPADSTVGTPTGPRFPPLTQAEAWAHLPDRVSGAPAPLPAWARVLARSLPRTTAAMLELDHLQRTGNGLAPGLWAEIRWAAARAGRSAYGAAYALADLRAAGLGETADRLSAADLSGVPPAHRAAMAFAEKLTADPQSVTDADVADLVAKHGDRQVVAMVLAVAYAHFQDRLVLTLGLPVEVEGPVPPLAVRFARRPFGIVSAPPPRRAATAPITTRAPDGPGWRAALDPDRVQCGMNDQRSRRPRIPLPASDPAANRWGLVGQTYQPELSTAWSNCTQAFGEEADQDPVFEQSMFWVVTATKGCFY